MEATNDHADLSVSGEHLSVSQASQPESATAELEKVRSILFGEQIRSTEDRLARLEERLIEKLAKTEARLEARLDDFEKKLSRRTDDIGDLKKGLDDHQKSISEELKKVDEALRETIISAASTVASDFESKTEALSQALEDSLGQLQQAKVDRSKLASIFSQLAEGLGE